MQTTTTTHKQIAKNINVKNQLHKLGQLLEPHQYNKRNELLDDIIAACEADKENDSEKMLAYLMAANLRNRFSGTGIKENLYNITNGISQIRLFDILIHQFPFVKYSQQMANDAIVEVMKQHKEVCIVDIGIGLGTQMLHILEKAKELSHLHKVVIVGIEPFENALNSAEEKIMAYKNQVHFDLQFIPVAEYIEHINLLKYKPSGIPCVVNASLALHHIKSDADRNRVISNIKALKPKAFLLIEPCVNHFTNDLAARILNSYEHFISLFRVVDRLDASNEDKNGLKLFFGRELEDILSKTDDERFEKHEPVSSWLHRLRQNKFNTYTTPLLTEPKEILGVSIQPYPNGYIGFIEQSETILSVIYAA